MVTIGIFLIVAVGLVGILGVMFILNKEPDSASLQIAKKYIIIASIISIIIGIALIYKGLT